jgi:Ca2+-binding EF-hand superfamily protein
MLIVVGHILTINHRYPILFHNIINSFLILFFSPKNTPQNPQGLVLYSVGYTPTAREAEEFGNSVADENGNVSYDSFMRIFAHTKVDDETRARELLAEAFKVFDRDEQGVIPVNDFRSIVTTLGEVISYEEADQLMQLVPVNEKGRFKASDFIDMLMTKWK